ncbi:glycosyltransferase [Flavobacterium branchiarum]|uniref:Glycosyltransferase family 2 protein n=1 Tax=Flavobacterium branchiarum TaxID=1114870 RepID=A0ABV5FNR8_9FLAO|nr:glycosyltransferase [Flavobacterium branchiarum]MDN3671937.1 glycosyltransferase [Flavobacterium branchiarum]
MITPLVTVIIPTYNRKEYFETAIQSVVGQSYANIEIIVVDDGSTDNYAGLICDKFSNCTYFYKKNGGIAAARNYGINLSEGEYIAFLDDDDFWESSKIEKQVKILLENPSVDCVHSSVAVVNEKGELTGDYFGAAQNKIAKRSGYVFWNALGCWVVKSPTPLIRKIVFQPDLLFDEKIKVGEDIDFYQRMFYRHKIHYINEPLAFYRVHNNTERLSSQLKKYIGIENKMFFNFKNMGIRNPFILHLIAVKLLKKAIEKNNSLYPEAKKTISKILIYSRPDYFLNRYFG